MEFKKGEDDAFKCKCGKRFKLLVTLRRHAKSCRGELAESKQAERKISMMDDASELMDFNDDVINDILVNCYGALFHAKLVNCRRRATSENRMHYQ